MAVVFISPKKRQKIFLISATTVLIILFLFIFGWIFLSKPSKTKIISEFTKPKVTINFKVLDTDQFKNLEKFIVVKTQFRYTARDKANKTVAGYISAESEEEAKKNLEERNFSEIKLQEVSSGRENPYIPY